MRKLRWFSVSESFYFFNDTAPTDIYTLSLHDALPIYRSWLIGFQWSVVSLGASLCTFDQRGEVLVPIDGEDRVEVAGSAVDRTPIALPLSRTQLAQRRGAISLQWLHVRRPELLSEFAEQLHGRVQGQPAAPGRVGENAGDQLPGPFLAQALQVRHPSRRGRPPGAVARGVAEGADGGLGV